MKWALALFLVAACAPLGVGSGTSGSKPPPAPARTTKLDLPIKHFALTNGLKVVLVEDSKAAEVQVTMRYRVGGIDDPVGQEGMAHLVEHVMFEQVLGGQSLLAKLQTIATSFNAFTTHDATTYIARARGEHLDALLAIEAVRMALRCTSITDAVFERERAVVVNELRQKDRAFDALSVLNEGTYPDGHPYRRSVAGTEQSVGSITREQACAFADAHYATKNAVLVISGDVTEDQATKSLARLFGRVPARATPARREVPAVAFTGKRVNVPGPVDDEVLVVTWAMPRDPAARAKFRTIADLATRWIDSSVKGTVFPIELGDTQAPTRGLVVTLAGDETLEQALGNVTKAVGTLPKDLAELESEGLGRVAFDQIRQSAAYRVFASLEDGSNRDVHLAADVLAGRDPRVALVGELVGLRELAKPDMVQIARDQLNMARASIVVVKPRTTGPKSEVRFTPNLHDLTQRRDSPDPATAHQPLDRDRGARAVKMQTRRLPNGMQVVLLPAASIPTVDIRLVFQAGTADEPVSRRGAAIVAARGLTFQPAHLNDLLLFAAAGGSEIVVIDEDHTEFIVRGMDMHLDALLAGLRRLVLDGWYGAGRAVVNSLRAQGKETSERDLLPSAWRTALFGPRHPYVEAGSVRHIHPDLEIEDAKAFRRDHFTPDNATLVIAGGFDPVLADRWIDHLFADWRGQAITRSAPRAAVQRASIARDEPGTMLRLAIALPAGARPRAEQLVLAEMLSRVAFDIREQLAASYDISAQLEESRLSTVHALSGLVEAQRAVDAIKLVRDRLERLRLDPDLAARTFASARAAVATRLAGITGGATALSGRVARDLALERAPMADADTAFAVRKLTIDSVDLSVFALDRAAILMRGPAAEIDRAFTELGRTATYVKAEPPPKRPASVQQVDVERPKGDEPSGDVLARPLTLQTSPGRFRAGVGGGLAIGTVIGQTVRGVTAVADVGYAWSRHGMVGAQLTIANLDGEYPSTSPVAPPGTPVAVVPIGAFLTVQGTTGPVRGGIGFGMHFDRVTDGSKPSTWYTTAGFGAHAGIALGQRFTLFGRIDTAPLSDAELTMLTLGLGASW